MVYKMFLDLSIIWCVWDVLLYIILRYNFELYIKIWHIYIYIYICVRLVGHYVYDML